MRGTNSVRRQTEILRGTKRPMLSDQSDPSVGTKRKMRPCPRGLEDTCPIPRELCVEEHERGGGWNCEKLLDAFEWFVFENEEDQENRSDLEASATWSEESTKSQ